MSRQYITPDQLEVGQYVHLELRWTDHPFAFSNFKIKTPQQLEALRNLALKQILFSPELSDNPAPRAPRPALVTAGVRAPEVPSPEMLAKRRMIENMQRRRAQIHRIEASFIETSKAIKEIERNLFSRPAQTVETAKKVVAQISDSILQAPELAIHVMGDMVGEEVYLHSLNVTMLSLMMARELKLPKDVSDSLALGALMHDIGLSEVPSRVLLKTGPLTQAERSFYELHCQYGVAMAKRLNLSAPVLAIVREHHEHFDGSGFPAKLAGDGISLLARIVAIANAYDTLCNPRNRTAALTPNEALATMFAKQNRRFDPSLLQVFIRCLGVYPPGTVVQLSNGSLAMVSTINAGKPLKPVIVVYDPSIPKDEAMMLDLEEADEISIAKALRPETLPSEVFAYLSPRSQVSYYFEAKGKPAR